MVPNFNVPLPTQRFSNQDSFSRLVSLFEPASSNPAAALERILRSPFRFSLFLHFVGTLDFSLMGPVFSSGSSCDDERSNGVPVILNVYDLTPLNNYLYWCGLGIFHSGIEVHGLEYGFGAHDFPTSGVFEVEPRNCPGFVYRCSLLLGYINMPPLEFRTFMESMSAEYYGDTYHLISKNCNHFTEDLCLRLTRQQIPGWINRIARLGATCNCLLPESLRLPSVKELPEYHVLSEDGSESVAFIGSHEPMDSDDADIDKHLLSQ